VRVPPLLDQIEDEFLEADLGDDRHNKRLARVAGCFLEAPGASIAGACGGWKETMAAYRLFHAPKVTPQAILAPHQSTTLRRAAAAGGVLVIQDTTEVDFTHMKTMEGLGPLNDESRRGFFLHSLYAVSEEGLPLGVVDTTVLVRADKNFRQTASRKKKPIEEKESYRWVEGYLRTQEVARQLPGGEVFSISDREGDIYEVYAAWARARQEDGPHAQWIIRGQKNRALEGLGTASPQKLFAALEDAPEFGQITFQVPAKRGSRKVHGSTVPAVRSARTVRQRLRAMEVTPRVPWRCGAPLPPVSFWAVLAEEVDPPPGEEPLRWLLLTSLEVTNFEVAQRIVRLYLRRWDIEVFHRVLKTGCRVERIQLKDHHAVLNALSVYLICAWRLLYLTHLGRHCPQRPCGAVFAEAEWKATCLVAAQKKMGGWKKGEPMREPALKEFMDLVARFGGHLGRRGDKPPGPQAMWQGLARVRDFACAWEAFYQD
jgi:hypothetical protein